MIARARVGAGRRSPRGALALAAIALFFGVLGGVATAEAKKDKGSKSADAAKQPSDPGDLVLATVGSSTITRKDFDARMAELPPQYKTQFTTPEQKRGFLDRMIEERVWLETAYKAKVDERADVKRQLENQKRDLMIRTYLGERMQKAPAPSDSMVKAYYDTHADEFMAEEQVKVRHIQCADEKTARLVLGQLAKGADFATLASKYSKDVVTKDKGGDLGTVTKAGFFGSLGRQKELADSAFAAPLNKPRGPIKTGLGWHVYEVTEKIPAKQRPFEEVKPAISQNLSRQVNQDFYTQNYADAKKALLVKIDSVAVDSALFAKPSPVEMFRMAGEIAGMEDRIAAYRNVVETYPESEYAPQALFMVGFVESEEKQDYDGAEAAFRELIAKYPKSELVSSAQWMIENMRSDKTPDFDLPGNLGPASGKHP